MLLVGTTHGSGECKKLELFFGPATRAVHLVRKASGLFLGRRIGDAVSAGFFGPFGFCLFKGSRFLQ